MIFLKNSSFKTSQIALFTYLNDEKYFIYSIWEARTDLSPFSEGKKANYGSYEQDFIGTFIIHRNILSIYLKTFLSLSPSRINDSFESSKIAELFG